MRILIITLITFFNITIISNTHDAISATFNVIEKGHVLMLEIEFDKFDYLKLSIIDNNKVTKEDFSKYLKKTTSWEIDGEKLIPKILSIKSQREHTKVICFLSKSKKNIKTVKVKNEFLINVKDHSNIIKLDLNDSFKDFRLHKYRRELKVDYTIK
ncbi:MAG: DUF6702 family protein [Polaribacter sp.]